MRHSVEDERKFHRQLINYIVALLRSVNKRLIDFPYGSSGERKNDENLNRDLQLVQNDTYYGVLFVIDLQSGQVQQFRIGRQYVYGDIDVDGIHVGVMGWQSPLAAIYNKEENDIYVVFGFGETLYKAQVIFRAGEVVELVESRAGRDAIVLNAIQKPKTENLGDILETIRPDQDSLVRMREDLPVVIQGGPGTGKTVVGLQRLAFATTDEEGRFRDEEVLAIGPTRSYVSYVKNYLPGLGVASFKNRTLNDLVLEALSKEDQENLKELREDTDEIVKEKNSPRLDEIIRKTIWPEVESFQIEFQRLLANNANPSAIITPTEIEKLLRPIYNQFQVSAIDYETARASLASQLQSLMLGGQSSSVPEVRNATNEQRIEMLLEGWLLKIGIRNQQRRTYWLKILERNAGRRIKREMASLLRNFYIRDIRRVIELVVNEQSDNELTLEPIVLRRKLEEVEAQLKDGNEDTENEPEVGVRSLQAEAIRDSDLVDAQGIRPQVQALVNEILPKKTPLEVASFVVTGTAPMYESQSEANKSLGRKLNRAAAFKDGKGDKYFWTDADIPVVGVVANTIQKTAARFDHVLVDEAQDLTRMQLKIVSHYLKNSSLTMLGDINQATKPAALGNWMGLMQSLGFGDYVLKTLEQNYRVPSDIFGYAVSYLPEPYDPTSIPTSELEGGSIETPLGLNSQTVRQKLLEVINSKKESERIVVISEDRDVLEVDSFNPERLKVVTPEECKGLEFDHSIIVTPADWYDGSTSMARRMYVVLTRATKSVTILQPDIENTLIRVFEHES